MQYKDFIGEYSLEEIEDYFLPVISKLDSHIIKSHYYTVINIADYEIPADFSSDYFSPNKEITNHGMKHFIARIERCEIHIILSSQIDIPERVIQHTNNRIKFSGWSCKDTSCSLVEDNFRTVIILKSDKADNFISKAKRKYNRWWYRVSNFFDVLFF